MKTSCQCLGFGNREVGCEFIVVPRRRGATSRIKYVAQRHCVTGVRQSEQPCDLIFKRQNVRTFRPLNTGTLRHPETSGSHQTMTRRIVKSFKIKTEYIYLKLISEDPAE
jgi:hypothetical protein